MNPILPRITEQSLSKEGLVKQLLDLENLINLAIRSITMVSIRLKNAATVFHYHHFTELAVLVTTRHLEM